MTGDNVILDEWERGTPGAHDHERISIIRISQWRYEVRRTGPVGGMAATTSEALALRAAYQMMSADWRHTTTRQTSVSAPAAA